MWERDVGERWRGKGRHVKEREEWRERCVGERRGREMEGKGEEREEWRERCVGEGCGVERKGCRREECEGEKEGGGGRVGELTCLTRKSSFKKPSSLAFGARPRSLYKSITQSSPIC